MTNRARTRAAAAVAGAALAALALSTLGASAGCGPSLGHPENASPIVSPDSEPGKRAIAESGNLLRLRAEQEAKARKRFRSLPKGG